VKALKTLQIHCPSIELIPLYLWSDWWLNFPIQNTYILKKHEA